VINLPAGYRLGNSRADKRRQGATALGGSWELNVYADTNSFVLPLAYTLVKTYDPEIQGFVYIGRIHEPDGITHRSIDLDEVIRIISTKHRLLGRK